MRRIGDDMRANPVAYIQRGQRGHDGAHDGRFLSSRTGGKAGIWIEHADLVAAGAKELTNWEGKRVVVFPLCWMDGEPQYPPVEVEPGEQRREIEAAISARYRAYREAKQRTGRSGDGGYTRG